MSTDRLTLHYSKFCGLSKDKDFRAWLRTTAPELDEYFTKSSPVGGCKANADRMVTVYNKLYETGKGVAFEKIIKERFPYVVDRSAVAKPNLDPRSHLTVARTATPIIRVDNSKSLNVHGIFKLYRPEILTFPQKRILVNSDPAQLQAQISHFIQDKFGVDTLIIGDHAYIEYFEPRYKDVVDKIPQQKRDIFQYRQKAK